MVGEVKMLQSRSFAQCPNCLVGGRRSGSRFSCSVVQTRLVLSVVVAVAQHKGRCYHRVQTGSSPGCRCSSLGDCSWACRDTRRNCRNDWLPSMMTRRLKSHDAHQRRFESSLVQHHRQLQGRRCHPSPWSHGGRLLVDRWSWRRSKLRWWVS